MDYTSLKNELIKIYTKYGNNNFQEIDYILSLQLSKNLFEVRNYNFNDNEINFYKKIINKKLKYNIPIQKLLNKAYFYKNEFYVNNNVLTPRQDSEVLIEFILKKILNVFK
jgi:release factor glutamine methyltransferase